MSLSIFTGLPASGKTSTIISRMQSRQQSGGHVTLILSSEHEALTRRPNVKPGGLMGCRDKSKSFPIDHVVTTDEAITLLEKADAEEMLVFDEAQYFQTQIVDYWLMAADRGVEVLVGTPSSLQLAALADKPHVHHAISVSCRCGESEATRALYSEDLTYPNHLCEKCYENAMNQEIADLLETVKQAEPFPGDLHTYQPFYELDMPDWQLVRTDCRARINIILDAISRTQAITDKLADSVSQPGFIDLGCCSGYFSHGMSTQGFVSAGVDVTKDFIVWASKLALLRGQSIDYRQQDVLAFLKEDNRHFDVISSFATIQWVMAQQGYDAGIACFDLIFEKADSVCVIEMGYTSEDIYREKITDRPVEIDGDWVLKLMQDSGKFHTIEVHPAGENGIWRDIFVGFRHPPSSPRVFDDLPVAGAIQTSNAAGYSSDDWVGGTLEVGLRAEHRCSKLQIEGWRPDYLEATSVRVYLSSEQIAEQQVGTGIFKLAVPVALAAEQQTQLKVETGVTFSPEGDARQLAFVLRDLSFS